MNKFENENDDIMYDIYELILCHEKLLLTAINIEKVEHDDAELLYKDCVVVKGRNGLRIVIDSTSMVMVSAADNISSRVLDTLVNFIVKNKIEPCVINLVYVLDYFYKNEWILNGAKRTLNSYKLPIDNVTHNSVLNNPTNVILVTSTTPNSVGIGKTVTTLGINNVLNSYKGIKSVACIREPSLGPVFGRKGGAAGAGYSSALDPMDMDLHLNGDIHAITSAHNLICACVDNYIRINELVGYEKLWNKKAMDMNYRELRAEFDITAASEVMCAVSLATSLNDLVNRLESIEVIKLDGGDVLTVGDINISKALEVLLRDAVMPNLTFSKTLAPVMVHTGNFANIAHGNSSVLADMVAIDRGAAYIVTEAGFGSDMGFKKFFDIKVHGNDELYNISRVVLATPAELYTDENMTDEVKQNLQFHYNNCCKTLKQNGYIHTQVVIIANQKRDMSDNEIEQIKQNIITQTNIPPYMVLVRNMSLHPTKLNKLEFMCAFNNYMRRMFDKVENTSCYKKPAFTDMIQESYEVFKSGSDCDVPELTYADGVYEALEEFELTHDEGNIPICICKSPMTVPFNKVTGFKFFAGGNFLTIYCDNVLTMPGLPTKPRAVGFEEY